MTEKWIEEFDKEFGIHIENQWTNENLPKIKAFITKNRQELVKEIIDQLESNPDPKVKDPSLQLWIEMKQLELRHIYLNGKL